MPLNCCSGEEKCLTSIPDSLISELVYLQGLNIIGCDRYESATLLVKRLQTPFTGVGENGIVVTQPDDDEDYGHNPIISFDSCQWVVPEGTIAFVLGKDSEDCVVMTSLEEFIEGNETVFAGTSNDGSLSIDTGGLAGHTPDFSVRLATDQGPGDNQIVLAAGPEGGLYVPPPTLPPETPITPVDTASVNLSVSGIANHNLQADVNVSSVEGNVLTIEPDGLSVTTADANIPVTKDNTESIAISLSGASDHHISAGVIVSSDAGNLLTIEPDGLYVSNTGSIQTPITPQNSSTVALSAGGVNSHTIQADVNISGEPSNILVVALDGLYVPSDGLIQTAITPVTSTTADVTVSGTDDHTVEVNVIVSPEPCNAIVVNSDPLDDGLYVRKYQSGYLRSQFAEEVVLTNGNLADLTPVDGTYWYNETVRSTGNFTVTMDCDRTGWLRGEIQSIPIKIDSNTLTRLLIKREYSADGGIWQAGRAGPIYAYVNVGIQTILIPEEWVDMQLIHTTGVHNLDVRVTFAEEVTAPFVSFDGTITVGQYSARVLFYDDDTYELF